MLCPAIVFQQLLVREDMLGYPDGRPSLGMPASSQVHPSDFRTSGKGKKQLKGGATPGIAKWMKRAGMLLSGSAGLSWTGEQMGTELCIWLCSTFEEPEEATGFVSPRPLARQIRSLSLKERSFQPDKRKARIEEGSAEAPTTSK